MEWMIWVCFICIMLYSSYPSKVKKLERIKISYTDKKSNNKVRILRIESISNIEILEHSN